MAFRKRNIPINRTVSPAESNAPAAVGSLPSGVRPSPLNSHPVTSTGSSSLDSLLGGHGGLPLGCSLLIEESGTTDFAGALLRYYAAEGLCHGHVVHIVGVGEPWARELPGLADDRSSSRKTTAEQEKMKIAWRYERLGQAGERALPDRSAPSFSSDHNVPDIPETPFCHTFDLTKRLQLPQSAKINFIHAAPTPSPFEAVMSTLKQCLGEAGPDTVHRVVIPTLLSPALYHPQAGRPEAFLRFIHALRVLLHQNNGRVSAVVSLPLELFPRSSATVRTAEILNDGVLEVTPFPHLMDAANSLAESGGTRSTEEQPQGLVRIHKLPLNTERGEGGAAGNSLGEDLAFTVSRRNFSIKPFSLPPLEGDQEAQKEAGKLTGKDVEF